MIRGEIRVKTRHFPTNIPWEFPGISARNWSKAWQVPKSNLATSQDTTFLVIWDVVVSWSRQSERWGDLDGMDLRDFVGDCWWLLVEFLFGDCLLQKKDLVVYLCVCSANRTYYVCFSWWKVSPNDLCFRSLGFLWEGTSKKSSSQSTNLSWLSDQPGLSAIWKHPMNLLPLLKTPGNLPQCVFAVGG